jgi:hypothetical protein
LISLFARPPVPGDGMVTGEPNTTIDGYPARRSDGIDGGT